MSRAISRNNDCAVRRENVRRQIDALVRKALLTSDQEASWRVQAELADKDSLKRMARMALKMLRRGRDELSDQTRDSGLPAGS